MHLLMQAIWGDIWKRTMQPMWLCPLQKCNLCDFASSRANNLRAHLKTHTGEKSNKCNQCDYPPPISSLPSLPATSQGFLIFHVSVFLLSTILHLFGPETGSTSLFPSFSLCISVFSLHAWFVSLKWSHFDPFWTIFFIRSTVNLEWFSGETVLEMLAWHCSTLREDINAITIMNNHLSWLEPSPQIPAPVFFKTKTPCCPVSWWHSQEVVQWFPASLELRQQWNHEKT